MTTTAKNITIIGRRWFQRLYGNTYHTVEVWVDGVLLEKSPEQYGYGDQYRQTAAEILCKVGILAPAECKHSDGTYEAFCADMRANRDRYVVTVSDVGRERDL